MADALHTQLTNQLDGTVARRSTDEILRGVPPAARGVQPEGLPEVYSLWQILEHVRITQADYFNYCVNPNYDFPAWPDGYWPDGVAPPSKEAWAESIEQFQSGRQDVREFINDPTVDLDAEIPHGNSESYHGATYAHEIASLVDHTSYHLGQFVTVRRLLDVWPPEAAEPRSWAE